MRIAAIAALAVLITGCGSQSEVVMLRHPETGQIVQCGPFGSYGGNIAAANQLAFRELRS